MSLLCAILCSTDPLQAVGGNQATIATAPAPRPASSTPGQPPAGPPPRRIRLSVTTIVNGAPAGDVDVETDTSGNASVDPVQLIALLEPVLSPPSLAALRTRTTGPGFVPVSELNSQGLSVAFDLAALRLNVVIPLEARAVNDLSIVDRSQYRRAGLTAPENFSAGITVTIANRFRHVSNFGDVDREPFNVLVEGFANFGGLDGVNLAFQGGYREGDAVVRQRTTLFHDDVPNAIRYSAGDLEPQTFGSYGVPASMVGIGVERLYETIQPYRNLRPAGRGGLTIERPSRVDVLVNGVLYRSLDLAPGQYNVRDFPFLDGLNEVQLVVRDETGRAETINLSFFSDIDLLDSGISIFSASMGFRRKRFGNFTTTAYEESPTFSGFYLRGVTDRITLGGSVQADRRNALVSGQAVFATPIGIFGVEGALDLNNRNSAQGAFILSYRLNGASAGNRSGGLNVDLQYRTTRFTPMEAAGTSRNRFRWDLNGRYQTAIDRDTYVSVNAGYSWSRDPALPDVRTAGASASRRFGIVNASLNYTYRHDERGTDHRGVLSFSIPIGRRQSLRGSYDTDRNRVSADYQLQGFEGLNQTDVRAGVARGDNGRSASFEIEHYSNRFRASVRHSYDRSGGFTQEFTDVAAGFGIGFADGTFALGRDAARGFAIVDAHRSLRNSQIVVSDSYSLGPSARTGALGPALVPTRRAYQPNSLRVDVRDLPVGYDIGPGRYDILPGAASGYSILVGSAASKTVLGRLVDATGRPMVFAAGTLVPVAATDPAQPVPFFTNRTGRLAASRVAPGRYRVVLSGETAAIGEIDVPEEGEAIVNIGELRAGEPR